MPVVADTSPLLNLVIIGHQRLLRDRFEEVVIPSVVHEELCIDGVDQGPEL